MNTRLSQLRMEWELISQILRTKKSVFRDIRLATALSILVYILGGVSVYCAGHALPEAGLFTWLFAPALATIFTGIASIFPTATSYLKYAEYKSEPDSHGIAIALAENSEDFRTILENLRALSRTEATFQATIDEIREELPIHIAHYNRAIFSRGLLAIFGVALSVILLFAGLYLAGQVVDSVLAGSAASSPAPGGFHLSLFEMSAAKFHQSLSIFFIMNASEPTHLIETVLISLEKLAAVWFLYFVLHMAPDIIKDRIRRDEIGAIVEEISKRHLLSKVDVI